MTRPDLETDAGRTAYRQEIKRVGRPLRIGGLVLILTATLLILSVRQGWIEAAVLATNVGYGMLGLGWALFLAATFMRTRHHKRRLAEGL